MSTIKGMTTWCKPREQVWEVQKPLPQQVGFILTERVKTMHLFLYSVYHTFPRFPVTSLLHFPTIFLQTLPPLPVLPGHLMRPFLIREIILIVALFPYLLSHPFSDIRIPEQDQKLRDRAYLPTKPLLYPVIDKICDCVCVCVPTTLLCHVILWELSGMSKSNVSQTLAVYIWQVQSLDTSSPMAFKKIWE